MKSIIKKDKMKFDTEFDHIVGSPDCIADWCGYGDYPKQCECGGLLHAELYAIVNLVNTYLRIVCDKCGKEEVVNE